jgi:transposase
MNKITMVGIDLAKHTFHVHAVDEAGVLVKRAKFSAKKLTAWLVRLPPSVVAMEACGSSNHWARVCVRLGHAPKLIAPQYVRAYVKTNKHDFADAEGIVEAASRPGMRFVAQKDEGQQVLQGLHRVRSQLIRQRTALSNQLRGLLLEFGVSLPLGQAGFKRVLVVVAEEVSLPSRLRQLVEEQYAAWRVLGERLASYEHELESLARTDERCRRLLTIPGVGPLTATALVAAVSDVGVFRCGREMSAWLGVVPRQASTGGVPRLLGISKRGARGVACGGHENRPPASLGARVGRT